MLVADRKSIRSPIPDLSTATNPLVVILLGPPGAGKGTHAQNISLYLKIPHVSTGDLFRDNIQRNTPIGVVAKHFINQGKLVPDELVLEMLFDRVAEEDCKQGILLDGCPRTIPQAMVLDEKMGASHKIMILYLHVAEELLIERICGRISCKFCGKIFHKKYNPPQESNFCDVCKEILYQRADDTEEILRKRLTVYRSETEPLIDYYRNKGGLFYEIDGGKEKNQVFSDVLEFLPKP